MCFMKLVVKNFQLLFTKQVITIPLLETTYFIATRELHEVQRP